MIIFTKILAFTGVSIALCAGLNQSTYAADLKVEVSGITQTKGEIVLSLFDQQGQWLRKAILHSKTAATSDKVLLIFPGLPEGEYAISAFQDLNGNSNLDRNPMGIPSEPYGFSNDATGNFGPPSFDAAKFKIDTQSKSIRLRLN